MPPTHPTVSTASARATPTNVAAPPATERSSPDALSWRVKLCYGPAAFAETLAINSITQLVNPVFAIALGVNPGLVGVAMAIPRLWDAFTNPVVGSISDNWRGRWGRRRPFIMLGAVLTGILAAALWWAPAGRSETFYFTWLLVGGILVATATDIFSVPYNALGLELAEKRHDRTRLMAWRSVFQKLGGVSVQWLFAAIQWSIFATAVHGARAVGIAVAVVIIALGMLPAIALRERVDLVRAAPPQVPLFASWRDTLRDRHFVWLATANICVYTSVLLVETVGLYLNIYYVNGGDLGRAAFWKGITGTAFHVGGLLSIPVVTWLAGRFGKQAAFMICTGSIAMGGIAKWFCYTPGATWQVVIPSVLLAPGLVAVLILVPSMLADLCERDRDETGARREGMYSAVLNWLFKLVNSGVLLVSGFLLVATGWENRLGVAQSTATYWWMRFSFAAGTVALAIASILLIRRYRPILRPEMSQ
jgi:glycoside/pentoside/hexuronide:cation symporter, GPH family